MQRSPLRAELTEVVDSGLTMVGVGRLLLDFQPDSRICLS